MSPPGAVYRGSELRADPGPAVGAAEHPVAQPEVGPELLTTLVPQCLVQELDCTSSRVRESRAQARWWSSPGMRPIFALSISQSPRTSSNSRCQALLY